MSYTVIGFFILITILLIGKLKASSSSTTKLYILISAEKAKQMLKDGQHTLVDVRTNMEVSNGALPDALHINVSSPSFRKELEPLDKNESYIVYCRSGRRSAKACNIMAKEGFSNLYNLEGGYIGWK